jgi:protein arginine N-methyltransferase 1
VDIIISEWMGYFLLYESMTETVLLARDKWLKPDGLMFPDQAVIYFAGIEDAEYREGKVDFWDDVYGIKMHVMKSLVLSEPLVDVVESKAICTDVVPVF